MSELMKFCEKGGSAYGTVEQGHPGCGYSEDTLLQHDDGV